MCYGVFCMGNDKMESPKDYINRMVAKYQRAEAPGDRDRVDTLVVNALRTRKIQKIHKEEYDKRKNVRKDE